MPRRSGVASLAGLALALMAGCGNSRTPVPSLTTPASPGALRTLSFPAVGIRLAAPGNWVIAAGKGSLLTTISSGSAVIALWRYARAEQPPSGARALAHARVKLIAEARTRDPRLELIRSKAMLVDSAPAVEIDAFEQVAGRLRRVRSTHVFRPKAEVVLEEYAPPDMFPAIDHAVFSPLTRSLALSAAAA